MQSYLFFYTKFFIQNFLYTISAIAQQSFIRFKLIKSYLCSKITEERLWIILSVEKSAVKIIIIKKKKFISQMKKEIE